MTDRPEESRHDVAEHTHRRRRTRLRPARHRRIAEQVDRARRAHLWCYCHNHGQR